MADLVIQKAALKGMLSLPRPILRLMAGGGVVYQGGRTLDPRIQFLAAQARGAPPMQALSPPQARRASREGLALVAGEPDPDVAVENLTIEGPNGPIPVRAYRPAQQDPAAPLM